jgi:hypothetical protein
MKVVLSERAIESLQDAPVSVRRAFEKQLRFLVNNLCIRRFTPKNTTKPTTSGRLE